VYNLEEECENGTEDVMQVVATREQMMEMIEAKTVEANRLYIKQLKQTLEFIEELDKKPDKDRLALANMINHLVGVLIGSIQGWQKWCNLNSMDTQLTLEELKDIVPKMKRLVKEWIKIDIAITEVKTEELAKKQEGKKAAKKKAQAKPYVS